MNRHEAPESISKGGSGWGPSPSRGPGGGSPPKRLGAAAAGFGEIASGDEGPAAVGKASVLGCRAALSCGSCVSLVIPIHSCKYIAALVRGLRRLVRHSGSAGVQPASGMGPARPARSFLVLPCQTPGRCLDWECIPEKENTGCRPCTNLFHRPDARAGLPDHPSAGR